MVETAVDQRLKVAGEEAFLEVLHEGHKYVFKYPAYGPDTFDGLRQGLESRRLSMPTLGETVSLLHAAWKDIQSGGNPLYKKVGPPIWGDPKISYSRNIVSGDSSEDMLISNTVVTYSGERGGVFVKDNPLTSAGRLILDHNVLETDINRGDKTVRFAKLWENLANPAPAVMIKELFEALVGKEGYQKLLELSKAPYFPLKLSPDSVRELQNIVQLGKLLHPHKGGHTAINGITSELRVHYYMRFETGFKGRAFGIDKILA